MIRRRDALMGSIALAGTASQGRAAGNPLEPLVSGTGPTVLGVAVMARNARGRVRFAEAAGRGLRFGDGRIVERPFTLDTPVRMASVSKLATAAGLMSLVQAGRLDLGADISKPLGFPLRHPAHPDTPITAAMLASHTSGLRDTAVYAVPLGRRLAHALTPGGALYDNGASFSPRDEPPGAVFTYANVNFAVLGQLIERTAGERFDRFITRALFAPLGLDCGFNWSGVSQPKRDMASAACRFEAGAWSPKVDAEIPPAPTVSVAPSPDRPQLGADDYRLGENGWVFAPQGGLRASVRDLDILAQAFARPGRSGPLTPSAVRRMEQPVWTYDAADRNGPADTGLLRSYGLSTQVLTGRAAPDGDAVFGADSADWRGHFGTAYGLRSGLWWNRKDGRTLVYAISGTPPQTPETAGKRSALSLWEEVAVDAGLSAIG